MNRYPTTETTTCPVCAWTYSVTDGKPETCPACERAKGMAELNRVLSSAERKG
jgi:rubrerythrin